MLVASPRMQALIARKARKRERRRLQFRDRVGVVRAITVVVREAREDGRAVTHWTFEGLLIAVLRAELCLRSVPWALADQHAREVVEDALSALGAKRPSWQEGQPEWTDGGVIRETRTNCANCHGPLPEGHKVYCSKVCGDAARARRYWHDQEEARRVLRNLERKRRHHAAQS